MTAAGHAAPRPGEHLACGHRGRGSKCCWRGCKWWDTTCRLGPSTRQLMRCPKCARNGCSHHANKLRCEKCYKESKQNDSDIVTNHYDDHILKRKGVAGAHAPTRGCAGPDVEARHHLRASEAPRLDNTPRPALPLLCVQGSARMSPSAMHHASGGAAQCVRWLQALHCRG